MSIRSELALLRSPGRRLVVGQRRRSGPPATIGGNDGPSAPSSRIRTSAASATSASVRPGEAALAEPLVDLVGDPRRLGHRLDLARRPWRGAGSRPARRPATSSTPSGASSARLLQGLTLVLRVVEADPPVQPLARPPAERLVADRPFERRSRPRARPARRSGSRSGRARSSAPTSARPLVPVNPVSQRTFGDRVGPGVAGPHEVADDQQVELALGDQPRPARRRGALIPSSVAQHLERAAVPVGPSPATRPITRPSRTDFRRHSSRESTSEMWTSTAGHPGRARARRGSRSCSGSRSRG